MDRPTRPARPPPSGGYFGDARGTASKLRLKSVYQCSAPQRNAPGSGPALLLRLTPPVSDSL